MEKELIIHETEKDMTAKEKFYIHVKNTINKIFKINYICSFESLNEVYQKRDDITSGEKGIIIPETYHLHVLSAILLDKTMFNEQEAELTFLDISKKLSFRAIREQAYKLNPKQTKLSQNRRIYDKAIRNLVLLDEDEWEKINCLQQGKEYGLLFLYFKNELYLESTDSDDDDKPKRTKDRTHLDDLVRVPA
jgi:hypothetical protein